jgi:uncharacterized protein YndB with AHSA1/START domain
MSFLFKLAAIVLALVLILVACVLVIGYNLPVEHHASRSILVHQTPAAVYAAVRDFESVPTWWPDVTRVVVEKQTDGKIHFRQEGKNGVINYELVDDVPTARVVTRILDRDLGFSGSWTYNIVAEGTATRLSITEDGQVSNIIFRFASRYVFGYSATMDSYLVSLARRFGETSTPQ